MFSFINKFLISPFNVITLCSAFVYCPFRWLLDTFLSLLCVFFFPVRWFETYRQAHGAEQPPTIFFNKMAFRESKNVARVTRDKQASEISSDIYIFFLCSRLLYQQRSIHAKCDYHARSDIQPPVKTSWKEQFLGKAWSILDTTRNTLARKWHKKRFSFDTLSNGLIGKFS